MASQPIISFSEPVYRQPKPKVSFAVIAGEGAQAVDSAVKTLPAATQSATLDDLAWRGMTDHLIATAEKLLSPRMYAAFLRWGEAASHFSTHYETDEEGDARCDANSDAVRSLAATSSVNGHDFALKTFIASLEHGDCGAFGHIRQARFNEKLLTARLAAGVASDVAWASPLVAQIDELSSRARRASPPHLCAIDLAIGAQITAAFSFARGLASTRQELGTSASEHVAWLRKRNEMVAYVNTLPADLSDSDEDALFKELHQLENRIEGTPPQGLSGLFTQLLFAVQIVAEGHELNEETAKALVRTSIAISGEGYLWADPANAAEPSA